VVICRIESRSRPAGITLAWRRWIFLTLWAECGATAGCGQLGRWLAETNCSEARTRSVVLRPARRALFTRKVGWILAIGTEAELCETIARLIDSVVHALAGPAFVVALARRRWVLLTLGTELLATAVRRQFAHC